MEANGMICIKVENGFITSRVDSPAIPDGYELAESVSCNIGDKRALWDENWNARPLVDLIEDKTIALSDYEKVEDGAIVLKSPLERIRDGIDDIGPGYKLKTSDNGTLSLETMTLTERLESGQITATEYNADIQRQRAYRFASEVDPVRFDIEEGKATIADMLALKNKIRAELPYIEV